MPRVLIQAMARPDLLFRAAEYGLAWGGLLLFTGIAAITASRWSR